MRYLPRMLTFALSLYVAIPAIIDGLIDTVEGEIDHFAIWVRRRKMKG
jgi:hypothetical protein